MARLTKEDRRLLVARCLLHLDILWRLEIDDLVEHLGIEEGDVYFAGAEELERLLRRAAERVLGKLANRPQFANHASLLEAVLTGSSVNAWAQGHGMSREHVSRTTWASVTGLVATELEGLRKGVYAATSVKNRPRE